MKIPLRGFIVLFLLFAFSTGWSQTSTTETGPDQKMNKDVKAAYEAYDAMEYTMAVELLKKAISEVRGRDEKTKIFFMIAESYRKTNDYRNAESYYEKAIKLGYKDPIAKLYYADMLKAQGNYEEAITAYQGFKESAPGDKRADIGIESSKKAKEWMDRPSRYQVDNMRDINSPQMDFSPIYSGGRRDNNELVFSSGREESEGNREDGWTGESFMDLYTTTAERKAGGRRRGRSNEADENVSPADLKWSTPVPLDEEGILNTEAHEGSATFDSRKKELYFTRCKSEKNKKLDCQICKTEKIGQNWKEAEQQIIGEDTTANVGHPSLSPDDNIMYFVSTDFGAQEHDIFMTTFDRRSKTWNTPKNLGPKVNTPGEEYYPFAHDDGYLYFASDGLPGMGGLDIFRIKLGEDGMPDPKAEAENMQYPINTSWDDFALIFEPGGDKVGFMSSNRDGGRGSDDIYAVVKTPLVFILEGVVTSSKTGQIIPEATVKLEGSDGSSYTVLTDKDGYYIFDGEKIQQDVNYNLNFEKKKFLTNTGDVTTVGIPLSSFEYVPSENQFVTRIKLNKALDPIEEPIVLPNVFFDLGKWDLRPEARQALDSVVTIMDNNPTIVIELRSHTDYRDSDENNKVLSQHRADTCVSYLVSKGVPAARMVARGMGETEPFVIPENYKGYGAGVFEPGPRLTEAFIKRQSPEKQEVANQINRRTDFKVLRDDYVPAAGAEGDTEAADTRDIISSKRDAEDAPGEIYILKERESFGTVSRKFGLNIVELKQLNNGLRGVRPFEGLQLKVTKDGNYEKWDATHYQIERRGQNFRDIARTLSMDRKELEGLNPDVDDSDLQPGFWIRIK